jgi:hypothetical protein
MATRLTSAVACSADVFYPPAVFYGASRASPSLATTTLVTDTDTGSLAGNDSSTAWSIAFSVGGVSAIANPVVVTTTRGADAASRTL